MEAYVNIPEPLATDVSLSTYDFGQPALAVEFENIPLERIKEVEPKFLLDQRSLTWAESGQSVS
jgi:hypothetical protein